MKYFFMIFTLCVLLCACTSRKDDGYYQYKENGVLVEEFDLLVAPQMDYEEDIPYEEQIKAINKTNTKNAVKLGKPVKPQKPEKKPIAVKID